MSRSQATPESSQLITLERLLAEREDEIGCLQAQNEILVAAINAAAQIMASAPAWHQMHREAIEKLQRVKKEMEAC